MTRIGAALLGWVGIAAVASWARCAEPPAPPVPDASSLTPPTTDWPTPPPEFGSRSKSIPTGPFLYAEYILVQPRRDNLSMGVLGAVANGAFDGRVESLQYELANGFRVGGGYRLPWDGWDVTASFAYFHSKFQRTVDAPDGSMIFPALGLVGAAATSADGDAALSYAVTDVDVGRTFSPSDSVAVRVFGGARFARINQSLKTIYSGGDLGNDEDYVNSPVRYLGGGLSVGSEANWQFFRGFGVYGKARFSLLAGEFDSTLTETVGGAAYVDIRDCFPAVTPVAELGVGVSYQGRHLFASAGYDLADWFNMVNGITVPDNSRPGQLGRARGDLTLEGLSLKLGFVY
jgi:hypothetical protein